MSEATVLMLSRDAKMVDWVGDEVERLGDLRLDAVDEIEDACVRATHDGVGLILVHVSGDVGTPGVARLLWVSSTLRRPVPVIAMSERYQVERAATLFRLGVDDYLSRSHHRDRAGIVIDALTLRKGDRAAAPAEPAFEPERALLSIV